MAQPVNARADIPTAEIVVHTGAVRVGTGAEVTGLAGAVYEATTFLGAPDGPYECTTDATGTCVITVPTEPGGQGYLWEVKAKTSFDGYYTSDELNWGTADTVNTSSYSWATDFITEPGTRVDVPGPRFGNLENDYFTNGRYPGLNFLSGKMAQSADNPAPVQRCGLDIALVLDQSGSMMRFEKEAKLKEAAKTAVDNLTGTPSSLAIYTFANRGGMDGTLPATATTAANAPAIKSFIDAMNANGTTNWDAGLSQVDAGHDLVLFLTDGNPTTAGDGDYNGDFSYFGYVEQGMFSANALKTVKDTRIVGVGIGLDGGEANLRAVTGPTEGSDYFLASTDDFGSILKDLSAGTCENTITVQKQMETADGTLVVDSPSANGWNFTGTTSAGTLGTFAPTATSAAGTGFTTAALTVAGGATPELSITEEVRSGYSVDIEKSECRVDGQPVIVSFEQEGRTATATFTGAADAPITCTFVNRDERTTGTFSVAKEVTGDGAEVSAGADFTVDYSYPAGTGFEAGDGSLTMTAGQEATSDPLPTGAVVTLSEQTPVDVPGATWGEPTFTPAGPLTIGGAGTNVAVDLVNPITLDTGTFSVEKIVAGSGAELVPNGTVFIIDWSYPAKTGVYPAASGSTYAISGSGPVASAVRVPLGAQVTLAENLDWTIPGATWTSTGQFLPSDTFTVTEKDATVALSVTNTAEIDLGTFSVTKEVTGDGAGAAVGAEFTVDYSYPAGEGFESGSGSLTLAAGETVVSDPLPSGAVVTVTEQAPATVPGATWGESAFTPAGPVTIGSSGTDVALDLVNPVTLDTGTFSLEKIVTGSGADLVDDGTIFTIDWSYPARAGVYPAATGSIDAALGAGAVPSEVRVPLGAQVTLVETAPGAIPGTTWTGTGQFLPSDTFTVTEKDATVALTVTNTTSRDLGTFSVTKEVTGDAAQSAAAADFSVDYSYPAGEAFAAGSGTLTLIAGQTVTSDPLPSGAVVTLVEQVPTAVPGATWGTPVFTPAGPLTIGGSGTTVAVDLVNPISLDTGAFSVVKAVTGDGATRVPSDATFTVDYTYPARDGVYPAGNGRLHLKNDGVAVTSPQIPSGAEVSLTETEPTVPDSMVLVSSVFTPSDTVTIGEAEPVVAVTLTNDYAIATGSFTITKIVTGSGAELVPPATTFDVEYRWAGGDSWSAGEGRLALLPGVAQTVSDVPGGATVTFAEDTPGSIAGGIWGTPLFAPSSLVIASGVQAEVLLTNTIDVITPVTPVPPVTPVTPVTPTQPSPPHADPNPVTPAGIPLAKTGGPIQLQVMLVAALALLGGAAFIAVGYRRREMQKSVNQVVTGRREPRR